MISRYLIIFILIMGLTGCRKHSTEEIDDNPWSQWEAAGIYWVDTVDVPAVSRLMAFYAADMYDKHRLELEDSCVLRDENAIYRFNISFSSQRLLNLCDVRLLLVQVVDDFIDRVNNHAVLSFQLDSFPLTANNVDLNINFESFFGLYVDPLYIGKAQLWDSGSYFYAFNNKNLNADWSSYKYELYTKSRELALFKLEADLPYSDEGVPSQTQAKERRANKLATDGYPDHQMPRGGYPTP